jgi:hypothetical protein
MLMAARFRPARIVRHLSAPYGARIALVDSFWGRKLQEGLYKVEFHTVHGTGSGVIYVVNGKLRVAILRSPSSAITPTRATAFTSRYRRNATIPILHSSRCSEPT